MKLYEHLDNETLRKLNHIKQNNGENVKYTKQKNRKNEKLSECDLRELMNMNYPRYEKRRGVTRQR